MFVFGRNALENNCLRYRIDLNGWWRFKPLDYADEICLAAWDIKDDDWDLIQVPDFWNGGSWFNAFGPFVHRHGYRPGLKPAGYPDHKGSAWYRCRVREDDALMNGRRYRYLLHFEAVAAGCVVYVNGQTVGTHLGAYDPFTFDVTSAWRPQQDNLISLRVDDLARFQKKTGGQDNFCLIGRGERKYGGGIWQSVWIDRIPWVCLDQIRVNTDGDELDVQAIIFPEDNSGLFRFFIKDDDRVVFCRETKESHLRERIIGVDPWSPRSPRLYDFTVEILGENGIIVDQVSRKIGFRNFRISDSRFYMNGEPYYIRGASLPPAGLIPEDEIYIEKYLQILKEHHIEVIHGSQEPLPSRWLDACDRVGMAVIQMSDFPWYTPPLAQAKSEWSSIVANSLYHPSVVMYCAGHECTYPEKFSASDHPDGTTPKDYLDELSKVVRACGCTLPVMHDMAHQAVNCGGSIDTWTHYWGWYYHTVYNYSRCLEKLSPQELVYPDCPFTDQTFNDRLKRGQFIDGKNPLIFTETLGAYSDPDDGHLLQPAFRMRRVGRKPKDHSGMAQWLEDNQTYAAHLAKEATEAMRRLRHDYPFAAGQLSFMAGNWLFHPLDAARMKPKPVLEAIGRAYQPLLVSFETWQRHFYSGRKVISAVQVIHDEATRPNLEGRVDVFLRNEAGQKVSTAAMADGGHIQIGLGQNRRVNFELEVPAGVRNGMFSLVAEFIGNGMAISNDRKVFCASEEWAMERLQGGSDCFDLFDPRGITAALLDRLNVNHRRMVAVTEKMSEERPLVLGRDCLDHLTTEDCGHLHCQAQAGRWILVLEQSAPKSGQYGPGRNASFRKSIPFLPPDTLELVREFTFCYPDRNSFEYDDFVWLARPDHPVFAGLDPSLFRNWGRDTVLVSSYLQSAKRIYRPEYREDGYMDDYRTEYPPSVTPLAECFMFLRDAAVAEVRCGQGGFLLSQLEIHRHVEDDPVALRFLTNLLVSIKSLNFS